MFRKFKNRVFDKAGFYVLRFQDKESAQCAGHRYEQNREVRVHAEQPRLHYSNVYSFFTTTPNTRDRVSCHDFGIYTWVNSYSIYGPIEWREMTEAEIEEFKKLLYEFDRKRA